MGDHEQNFVGVERYFGGEKNICSCREDLCFDENASIVVSFLSVQVQAAGFALGFRSVAYPPPNRWKVLTCHRSFTRKLDIFVLTYSENMWVGCM